MKHWLPCTSCVAQAVSELPAILLHQLWDNRCTHQAHLHFALLICWFICLVWVWFGIIAEDHDQQGPNGKYIVYTVRREIQGATS